jgi:hypothetical protein
MNSGRRLSAHEERAVAVAACADPRTVRRVVAGEHVCSTTRARVEAALRELGLAEPPPVTASGKARAS